MSVENQLRHMKGDCSQCSGLCCTALFFSQMDGFPKDKRAGKPCLHLRSDFRCEIHQDLARKNMKGCIGYDCFGAGQHVTQVIYQGKTWQSLPQQAQEIFDVFIIVFHLYQIRFFLEESLSHINHQQLCNELHILKTENINICQSTSHEILTFDWQNYNRRSHQTLQKVCEFIHKTSHFQQKCPTNLLGKNFKGKDLSGMDLSTKLLIATHFEECQFQKTIFLGADTRDTHFDNADLSGALFLTQAQINAAKGNRQTKLPAHLDYPDTWK